MSNQNITASVMYTLSPPDQEWASVHFIKSGWEDLYHVIIEDAVYGSKMLANLMTLEDIETKYNVTLPNDGNTLRLHRVVTDHPNDANLGAVVRKFTQSI